MAERYPRIIPKDTWKVLLLVVIFLVFKCVDGQSMDYRQLSIKMPGARAKQHDDYLCTSIPVNSDEEYIVHFEANATEEVAHHMILSGCDVPGNEDETIWNCGDMGGQECASEQQVLYAWAKNAPPKDLPKGVGFRIGRKAGIGHLILQVHYKYKAKGGERDYSGFILHTTQKRQPYLAGIYLLWGADVDIPPNAHDVHVDLGCKYEDDYPIFAFAYRTHAHGLGKVISGYRVHGNKWTSIGKGDPQAPQAFYPLDKPVKISKGDQVAARCTFDSTRRHLTHHVHIGSTGQDEMCNFYMMYYRDAKAPLLSDTGCGRYPPRLSKHFPADSDVHLKTKTGDELSGSKKRILDEDPPGPGKLEIKMPGAEPNEDNDYLCTSVKIEDKEKYIVHFDPKASSDVAHHMMLFGCGEPGDDTKIWKCGDMGGRICKGDYRILYAWANDAPSKDLPKDVGFKIGKDSGLEYLVLQVHYKHSVKDGVKDHSGLVMRTTSQRQRNTAGILVIWAKKAEIPPHTNGFHVDIGCKYQEEHPIYAFAYRTHAHSLGRVVTGYRIHRKQWSLLGRGDPKAAQAFYPMNETMLVSPGDLLVARCTYDTKGRGLTHAVSIGATGKDEMCNFYVMFYRDSKYEWKPISDCSQKFHSKNFPVDSDAPLRHPTTPEDPVAQVPDGPPDGSKSQEGAGKDHSTIKDKLQYRYQLQEGWPKLRKLQLGQVSGVALDRQGNVVVFHRGSRTWDENSFDEQNGFLPSKAISQDTVISFDRKTGNVIDKWGQNMFYMPHGLTIDHMDNVWVTDVALHQVRKYPPQGGKTKTSILELGEKFRPGSDDHHFCQPTDVAVETSGTFYVADGYCNSRIMKFSKDGRRLLASYGHANPRRLGGAPPLGSLYIPHSLALDESNGILYTADRENGRIQRLDISTGEFDAEIYLDEFGPRVFAVDYSSHDGGVLHVVNGESVYGGKRVFVQGFTVNTSDGSLITKWPGQGNSFTKPHDVAASSDNQELFVAQLSPSRIWKLKRVTFSMKDMHPDTSIDIQPGGHQGLDENRGNNKKEEMPGKSKVEQPQGEVNNHFHGHHDQHSGRVDDYRRPEGFNENRGQNKEEEKPGISNGEQHRGEVNRHFHGNNDRHSGRVDDNHHTEGDDGEKAEKGGSMDEWLNALPSVTGKEDTEEKPMDICSLDMEVGPCKAAFSRWYYKVNSNNCNQFNYGGCKGNGNNFRTKEECLKACHKDICSLDKDEGPCRAAFPKWYYDANAKDCLSFLYGGCNGNGNKFKTKAECLKVCYKGKITKTHSTDENGKSDEAALNALSKENDKTPKDSSNDEPKLTSAVPTTVSKQPVTTDRGAELAAGEDEGPESNIHYNNSDYPPYHGKGHKPDLSLYGNASIHKLHKPTTSSELDAVGMIPALIILSVLAVPIVFLLLISIVLRVRAYRRETRFKASRLLNGKEPGLGVSRAKGWCSYLNCCDRRKYGFDKVNLAEFYSDSDSEGV